MYCDNWLLGGFLTLNTFIGFLSYVSSLMYFEAWVATEGFPTMITFIGFLSCMCSLMLSEIWLMIEGLPTCITLIRFLPCVYSLMYCENLFLRKWLPTLITSIGLLTCEFSDVIWGLSCKWRFSHTEYSGMISPLCVRLCIVKSDLWQKVFPHFLHT